MSEQLRLAIELPEAAGVDEDAGKFAIGNEESLVPARFAEWEQ